MKINFFVYTIFLIGSLCLVNAQYDASVTQENDKEVQVEESDFGSGKNVLCSSESSKEETREDYLNPSPLTAMNDFDGFE